MTDWLNTPDGDLDEFGGDTTSDEQDLEQDVIHRLSEAYGSNPDDRDRGVGVDNFLSGSPDLQGLDRAIADDLTKDDRIDTVDTTIVLSTDSQAGSVFEIDIIVNEAQTISTTAGGSSS